MAHIQLRYPDLVCSTTTQCDLPDLVAKPLIYLLFKWSNFNLHILKLMDKLKLILLISTCLGLAIFSWVLILCLLFPHSSNYFLNKLNSTGNLVVCHSILSLYQFNSLGGIVHSALYPFSGSIIKPSLVNSSTRILWETTLNAFLKLWDTWSTVFSWSTRLVTLSENKLCPCMLVFYACLSPHSIPYRNICNLRCMTWFFFLSMCICSLLGASWLTDYVLSNNCWLFVIT